MKNTKIKIKRPKIRMPTAKGRIVHPDKTKYNRKEKHRKKD